MPADRRDEHAALVALLRSVPKGTRWGDVTEGLLECGSAVDIWAQQDGDALIASPERTEALVSAAQDLDQWQQHGWQFLGILDQEYPARVREVHQAPPFLFAAGTLKADDPAIAVVGSRKASPRSLEITTSVATTLAREGITVVSGLADGVDTAAHRAALDAGGRTVAVIGTGIARTYPPANKPLQSQIARDGLVLSQFWPDAPPQKHNFIMRNAVMSGYGRATVVVQAGEHSGARAQARMAVQHGRPVILTDHVASETEWGAQLQGRPSVYVAATLVELMRHVHTVLDREREVDALLRDLEGSTL